MPIGTRRLHPETVAPQKCTEKLPQTRCTLEMKAGIEAYRRQLGLDFGQAIRRLLVIALHVESLDLSQHSDQLNPDDDRDRDEK